MNEEIIPINQDENSVSIYNQTLDQFKSLFYLVKGKRDTQIKLYSDNKSFSRDSIIALNEKIQEKLSIHTIPNKLLTITVSLSKNHIKSFGNWNEFLLEKWETSQTTDSITLDWDFEMLIPNRVHTFPQTHSLKVRLGQGLKPSEFFQIMIVGGDESELEESQAQMVAKVDFVNATIATELLEKVNEWYEGLPQKSNENKLNVWLDNQNSKIALLTETFIIIAGLALFFPIGEYLITKTSKLDDITLLLTYNFYALCGIFLSFTIFSRLGQFYGRKINRKIDKLRGTPLFEMTNGDRNELIKILQKNKSLRNEIFTKIFISTISSLILATLGYGVKFLLENI